MLIQFSVKNYKSFKEEQVFSMEAGTGDENIENIVTLNETRMGQIKEQSNENNEQDIDGSFIWSKCIRKN